MTFYEFVTYKSFFDLRINITYIIKDEALFNLILR